LKIKPPSSFEPLDAALRDVGNFDWLILTSVNGVDALFERLEKLRIEPAKLNHLQVAAIGPATQRAIERHGLKVAVTPEKYIAESVGRSATGKDGREARPAGAGQNRARRFAHRAEKTGAAVEVVEAYETIFQPAPKQIEQALCRRAGQTGHCHVHQFIHGEKLSQPLDKEHRHALREVWLASIGPVTSATLRSAGFKPNIEAGNTPWKGWRGHCQASAAWA